MNIKIYVDLEIINDFCAICDRAPFRVDVIAGRYTVDGSSIMGMMSFCERTVDVVPVTDDIEAIENFFHEIEPLGAMRRYENS